MTTVTVRRPVRTASQPLAPEDFADIAPCVAVGWSSDGALAVRFDCDLTSAQSMAVRLRCISTNAREEAELASAAAGLRENLAYLASRPTSAQVTAQVAALTRQVNGLIRFMVRDEGVS